MKITGHGKLKRKLLTRLLIWLVLITYMFIIFGLSAQDDFKSHNLSTNIAKKLCPYLIKIESRLGLKPTTVSQLNYRLRKLIHFIEYFLLAVLLFIALSLFRMKYYLKIVIILGACITYAVFDEVHQMFVPGRGPGIRDVFIDSCGAVSAVFILLMMRILKGRVH